MPPNRYGAKTSGGAWGQRRALSGQFDAPERRAGTATLRPASRLAHCLSRTTRCSYCRTTFLGSENSEVLTLAIDVVVAVILCPAATGRTGLVKLASPFASVVTPSAPMGFLPSLPEGLEKSRISKTSLGVLLSLPLWSYCPQSW